MIRSDAKVLVIIVARIGDTLLATPALRALKAAIPQGRLTVLAHPKRLEVLQHLSFIDVLEGITKTSATVRGWIVKNRYDYALVYGHDAALVRYALRASEAVIAFRQHDEALNRRLAHLVEEPSGPEHAVLHRLSLLVPLGLAADDLRLASLGLAAGNLRLAYCVTGEERAWARRWLAAQVPSGRPLIGLQIASFPTKSHRDWPASSFRELIARIAARYAQARFLLLGDAAAAAKAAPLLAAFPQQVALAAGRLSLRQSAALMAELDLYIGVDTGPTHIAGALGIPMVALYHCAYPGRNLAPLQHPACVMIEHPLTGRSRAATASMADIPVAAVWQAATDLLARGVQP
ncbi:MAG TPA: glycosyltransferase family 9 protein [Burkholderiales bacterium]